MNLDEWFIAKSAAGDLKLYHTKCKHRMGGPAHCYTEESTFCCSKCGRVPPQEMMDACLLTGVWQGFVGKVEF